MGIAVRVTSKQLRSYLGEPDDVDIQNTGATIMRYKWHWNCGCRAEGTIDAALCAPCAKHNALINRIP
jgi:hypothetical protein